MLTRHRFLQLCAGAATAPLARAALAQAIPSGAISVRDFGARGDGISNDSPGINAALQASQAKGDGGTVFLPAGRYVLRGITQARPRPIYTRVEDGIDVTRVAPQVRAHIFLSGLSRLSLVGERGTVLVLRDATACGIYLERCADVVVRDLRGDRIAHGGVVGAIDEHDDGPRPLLGGDAQIIDRAAIERFGGQDDRIRLAAPQSHGEIGG